jgi:hypothetical protein
MIENVTQSFHNINNNNNLVNISEFESNTMMSTLIECVSMVSNESKFCNDTNSNSTTTAVDEQYIYFLERTRFWIQRVLVPIIMIIGTIGNTITIVIMTRRRMRSSTNWYLAALATFDMLYLIFTFILSFQHYSDIEDVKYYYYWLLWPFAVMICDGSSNTSIWLTVTFTIER